jgi:DNA repair protein RadC
MKVSEFIQYNIKNHYTTTNASPRDKKIIIRSSKDIFDYCKDMQALPKEYLRGLYFNTKNKIIHDEIISIGTIDSSIAHPRDIIRPAILHNAASFIIVHNHPSGDTTPSQADIRLSEILKKASDIICIQFLDSVIIAGDNYISCK